MTPILWIVAVLLLLGLICMIGAAVWKKFAPNARFRGMTPLVAELLGVALIVAALWRFPMARWIGLALGLLMVITAAFRAIRKKMERSPDDSLRHSG